MRVSVLAGVVLVLAAACGGQASGPTPVPATPTPAAAACAGSGGAAIAIADSAFNPQSVTIAVGGSATWTNTDSATHTVTFDDGPDCGQVSSGASVSRTFDTAGTFAYHCRIHGSMTGSVIVE